MVVKSSKFFSIAKKIGLLIGIVLVLGLLFLISYRMITGKSLGLRSLVTNQLRAIDSQIKALRDHNRVKSYNRGEFTNILFIHHSVGNNLIIQGNVREKFTQAGFNLWDHDYNSYGLTDPQGKATGYSYNFPNDNTDPDGYARVFSQKIYGIPLNTLSAIMQHEVIIIKSCFPANDIVSDDQLMQYKNDYLKIRAFANRHPKKLFIIVTIPPLNPAQTNSQIALRSRSLANWLQSDEFLQNTANVFTFDLFNYLAESNPEAPDYNMLRQEYRQGEDSHPNLLANQTISDVFLDFIVNVIQTYRAH